MKLLLHPGHSKCGSTSLQKAIIKNRRALEKQGFIIPDRQLRLPQDKGFNPADETPRAFFRELMETGKILELKNKLSRMKDRCKDSGTTIIISAENLVNKLRSAAGKCIHHQLQKHFDGVQVVYYIKRQDDYLLSSWQQWGYKKGEDLRQHIDHSIARGNPNFRIAADFFYDTYGSESFSLAPVHKDFLHNGSLLEDFFRRISADYSSFDLTEDQTNKSLNPILCDILSQHPHLFKSVHDESIKKKLESIVGNNSLIHSKAAGFFPREKRISLLKHFESDNQYLSKKYIGSDSWCQANVGSHVVSSDHPDWQNKAISTLLSMQMEILIRDS